MMFYNQQDILKWLSQYDECEDFLSDLLEEVKLYDEKEICNQSQSPNINFICNTSEVNRIISGIIKNNNGKIIFTQEQFDLTN